MEKVICAQCGKECKPLGYGDTRYGKTSDGKKICFACCAERDKATMDREGRICLYLTHDAFPRATDQWGATNKCMGSTTSGKVANWPGTLAFPCHVKVGRHNIARTRYDVWFTDHNGNPWHGVQYGDNTQICHCRKISRKGK